MTDFAQQALGSWDDSIQLLRAQPVSGGSINRALRLDTNVGSFFLKHNSAKAYPGMFDREAEGLEALGAAQGIRVPKVEHVGRAGDQGFLVLEWIASGREGPHSWEAFGRQLAQLHKQSQDAFGADLDNFIGSLPQDNKPTEDWAEFFALRRLEPLVKQAREQGALRREDVQAFERLYGRLDDLFPVEPPALLHGDLWSGNYLWDQGGEPVLIDPAVYFGHREMDLAMTFMFGGFSEELYKAYHEVYPLESDWRIRVPLCNLYPTLVHVVLFGGGYVHDLRSNMSYFV
ncbi:fructosamine kinase family protein [Cryomorphaceae bacterium]|nr:fructosamine kinase family protein [Cryomorphaceae bacterium]